MLHVPAPQVVAPSTVGDDAVAAQEEGRSPLQDYRPRGPLLLQIMKIDEILQSSGFRNPDLI